MSGRIIVVGVILNLRARTGAFYPASAEQGGISADDVASDGGTGFEASDPAAAIRRIFTDEIIADAGI